MTDEIRELPITPEMEADIILKASQYRLDPAMLRYFVQYGPPAPSPPEPPPRWKVAWWRLCSMFASTSPDSKGNDGQDT